MSYWRQKIWTRRSMEIEIAGFGVRIRRLRIQIDDGLANRVDQIGVDQIGTAKSARLPLVSTLKD